MNRFKSKIDFIDENRFYCLFLTTLFSPVYLVYLKWGKKITFENHIFEKNCGFFFLPHPALPVVLDAGLLQSGGGMEPAGRTRFYRTHASSLA